MTRFAVSRLAQISTVLTICVLFITICSAQEPALRDPTAEVPATQPAPAAEQLTKIVESMRNIEARLKDRETGDETQTAQQNVIDQLDKLLNMPPDSSPPSGSGGGSSNNNSSSSKSGGGKSRQQNSQSQQNKTKGADPNQMQPKPAGQQGNKDRKNADDAEERTGPSRAATTPAAKRERLKVDVWGHLPEKLREQLLNSYGERMLPQYEEAVRRFYDQLADPQSTRRAR